MNSSAKQILIGWIYRRIGFLKRGMKKQIKPLATILRFLDFSIPPYPHFECSEKSSLHSTLSCFLRRSILVFCFHTYDIIPSCKKDPSTSLGMTLRKRRFPNISFIRDVGYPFPLPSFRAQREIFLALCSFLLLSQKHSRFLLSHIRHYPLLQERSLGSARDDVAEAAFSQHILYTGRGLPIPHTVISSKVEKYSSHSTFSCSFRKRFPIFRYHTYGAIPVCQKDPSTSLGMTIREALSKHIRCTLHEINPFPHTVMRGAARNLPCTLRFFASFAEGFPFSAVSHTTLYQYARKIPRLRSG